MQSRRALRLVLTLIVPFAILAGWVAWTLQAQLQREALRLPLIEAVIHQDSKEVKALLKRGANPNARSYPPVKIRLRDLWRQLWRPKLEAPVGPYPTALMLSSQLGDLASMKSLLVHGADPNARISDGRTALLVAAQYGNSEAVQCLLDHGANIHARDQNGRNALIWSMDSENTELQAGEQCWTAAHAGLGCFARGIHRTQKNTLPPLLLCTDESDPSHHCLPMKLWTSLCP